MRRFGDVFAEITERLSFPVFGFSVGWSLALGRSKRRLPEKNCASGRQGKLEGSASGDQELGSCDMLCPI
jgi:hypothetical protein